MASVTVSTLPYVLRPPSPSLQIQEKKDAVLAAVTGEGGAEGAVAGSTDADLMGLVDGVGGAVDAEARLEVFQRLCAHRDMWRGDVEGEEGDWRDTCEAFGVHWDDKLGGWLEADHFTYTKVLKEVSSRGRGQDRSKLLSRLALELPMLTQQQLDAHDRWYKARRSHMSKLKDLELVQRTLVQPRCSLAPCSAFSRLVHCPL